MSIGELTNLYRNGELLIRPEFQRFFRWSNLQKSRLIESILLGIPLPSIFVAQTDDGVWELVDGLQRVSTILQLQGELKGQHGITADDLILSGTKYLPALEGKIWEDQDKTKSFTQAQRLDVKRSKIDVKIIKRESSHQAKFDLFQRLNSYGSQANAQEMRSALLVAVSPETFSWIENLSRDKNFRECVPLSERLIEERYDLELVTRFIVLHDIKPADLKLATLRDLPTLLDEKSIEIANGAAKNRIRMGRIFEKTFEHIAAHGSELVFRRWDAGKNEFKGSFLNTAYEIFALGVGYNISVGNRVRDNLLKEAKDFWSSKAAGFATGKSTESRLVEYMPIGRQLTKG